MLLQCTYKIQKTGTIEEKRGHAHLLLVVASEKTVERHGRKHKSIQCKLLYIAKQST